MGTESVYGGTYSKQTVWLNSGTDYVCISFDYCVVFTCGARLKDCYLESCVVTGDLDDTNTLYRCK